MADLCDFAAEESQRALDLALAEAKRKAARPSVDHPHCLECGDEIPKARRALLPGVECCVYCQSIVERRGVR
jgi:phage/conjugal plasmid C-4 type zinc finger TraR family protein